MYLFGKHLLASIQCCLIDNAALRHEKWWEVLFLIYFSHSIVTRFQLWYSTSLEIREENSLFTRSYTKFVVPTQISLLKAFVNVWLCWAPVAASAGAKLYANGAGDLAQ